MLHAKVRVCLYGLVQPMLIVPRVTGVYYHNQTHGVCCLQDELEGFLVPVADERQHEDICAIFPEGHYGNIDRAAAEQIERILQRSPDTRAIRVDWYQLSDSHEAWLHVRLKSLSESTYEGLDEHPAVLTWANSD